MEDGDTNTTFGDVEANKIKIGSFASIDQYSDHGLKLIKDAIQSVISFPSGASRTLYCAYPTFNKVVDLHKQNILDMVSNVLINQNIKGNIERRIEDEKFELLLECNDVMLERINSNLDEIAGLKKRAETILVETIFTPSALSETKSKESWNRSSQNNTLESRQTIARLLTAKNIVRPQTSFKTPVDNNKNNPFEPQIKDKPNSLKPLAILPEYGDDGNIESYLHPYEYELTLFRVPKNQLVKTDPIRPKSIEKTQFTYVDNEQKLNTMLEDLKSKSELAIDLENHSYRTFQGITCLIQISTRENDYIIDTLKLREELQVLNEVLTNPKILKIFHGADYDIEWLQRDFSLYVVNMFDTHQAAKLLDYPRLSLAYLLLNFCKVEANKIFQLADWRMRPLPDELIYYARQDTHFLICIYDYLKNELIDKANGKTHVLEVVYSLSADICKRRYFKPRINNNSYMNIYQKAKKFFDNRQLCALRELFHWRDHIARQEDESYGYVLPNHMMLHIAESLPREMQGILSCCNPIPPLVRQNLHVLHQIILQARKQPVIAPIIDERIVHRVVPVKKDINSGLHCPHDLTHMPDFRDDLPTLLNNSEYENVFRKVKMAIPCLNVFETSTVDKKYEERRLLHLYKINLATPYERYKAVVPYAEREKLAAIIKQEPVDNTNSDVNDETEEIEINSESADVDTKKRKPDDVGSPEQIDLKKMKPEPEEDEICFNPKIKTLESNNKSSTAQKLDVTEKNINPATSNSTKSINELSKKKRKFKYKSKNKTAQASNKPVNFDYSKVDYKKFEGGSQKGKVKGFEIKTSFNPKNRNKMNDKKLQKILTFNNKKGNKK